jgi:hypothetical protein
MHDSTVHVKHEGTFKEQGLVIDLNPKLET